MSGYFYILASKRNGTLYCGVTNDLVRRVSVHRSGAIKGFTTRYKIRLLVYYEIHDDIAAAIYREKCVKEWQRKWKLGIIEEKNPQWKDLYADILQQ